MARSVAKGTLSTSPDVKPETFLTPSHSPTRSVFGSTSPLIFAGLCFLALSMTAPDLHGVSKDYRNGPSGVALL